MTNYRNDACDDWREIDTDETWFDQQSRQLRTLPTRINWSGLLRSLGAMTVVAGMCAYLLESWDTWNGISRYYVMLAGSTALALAGFGTSYLVKENKGARVFFGLALICAMVTMTTLGGFINAVVNRESALLTELNAGGMFGIDWFLADATTLITMGLAALLVLTPIAWFAFKIMNRPHAERLLACFAACGTLLLLPVRESLPVSLLILLSVLGPFFYLYRCARDNPHFKTREGKFSAAVLFAPAIIMVARMLWLYEADALLGWILSAIAFTATQLVSRGTQTKSGWLSLNAVLATGLAAVMSLLSVVLLQPFLPNLVLVPLAGAIFAGLCQLIGWQGAVKHPSVSLLGYAMLALVTVLNGVEFSSLWAWTLCVGVGVTLAFIGHRVGSRALRGLGFAALACGSLPWFGELSGVVDFTNWMVLALIGVSAIVGGSLLESRKRKRTG